MATPEDYGYESPSTWRLRTSGNAELGLLPLPYKYVDFSGTFREESGTITTTILIEAANLRSLLLEFFPPPRQIGNLLVSRSKRLEGLMPNFAAAEISVRGHASGVPVDPVFSDLVAVGDLTYQPVLEVEITYEPRDPENENPLSFLELTAEAGGDFIHAPAEDTSWGTSASAENAEQNTSPIVPVTIMVPTTEWSLKWPVVPFAYFRDTLLPRMRKLMGKVNNDEVEWLYFAPRETLLFVGFSMQQRYSWRLFDADDDDPEFVSSPVEVTMKIVEKNIEDPAVTAIGHNHHWQPGKGWAKFYTGPENKPTYEEADFDVLFLAEDDDAGN